MGSSARASQQGQVGGLGDVVQRAVHGDDLGVADAMTMDGRRGVVRSMPVGEGEMSTSVSQQHQTLQAAQREREQPGSGAASCVRPYLSTRAWGKRKQGDSPRVR